MDGCVYVQRCVSVDNYLATPIPTIDHVLCPLSSLPIRKVPVLRMYGPTQLGQKACVHIHGVYPYLALPAGQLVSGYTTNEIYLDLETSLNRSYGSSNGQYIHQIEQLSATPFYGFHEHEQIFLKVSFYQPRYVKRTAELLLQGSLRGKLVQPHEAHFPYSLQFLTDYNIHGMNLVYFNKVLFRTTEEQYNTLVVDEGSNYLAFEIDITRVPLRHLINPEDAIKKCSSSLELDATVTSILNVNFIDVNCNPGLKAICEEERQRRHQAGTFTPSQKIATPVRNSANLPQTKKWEEKLCHIIQNASNLSSQQYDPDVVDFLEGLDMTQSQNSSQSAAIKVLSQRSYALRQMNLSLRGEREDGVSSEDEKEESLMMTQRVFYNTDMNPVVNDTNMNPVTNDSTEINTVVNDSTEINPVTNDTEINTVTNEAKQETMVDEAIPKSSSDEEDHFDDMAISDSELLNLQLDGNCDADVGKVVRKRKRLGGRPTQSAMLSVSRPSATPTTGRLLRSTKSIGKELFRSDPVKSNKTCTRDMESPNKAQAMSSNQSGKRKVGKAEAAAVAHQTSSILSSPKGITKIKLTQDSPGGKKFDLSQFNDLRFSPSTSREKKFKELDIISPGSSKTKSSRVSLSRKKKKRKKTDPIKNKDSSSTTPVKDWSRHQLTCHNEVVPKILFSPSSKDSPRKKFLAAVTKLDTALLDSIESLTSSESDASSSESVASSNYSPPIKQSKPAEKELSITQEIKRIEEEQNDLDNKVLMWLSESECSQDEGEEPPPPAIPASQHPSNGNIFQEPPPPAIPASQHPSNSNILQEPPSPAIPASQHPSSGNIVQEPPLPASQHPSNSNIVQEQSAEKSSSVDLSLIFSKDSFTYSPKSPASKKEASLTSNKSSTSLFGTAPLETNSSKQENLSLGSKIQEKGDILPSIDAKSPKSLNSSLVQSGSDVGSTSLFSTPRNMELDSSLFFSQYDIDVQPSVFNGVEYKTFNYNKMPPSFVDCRKYIQQTNSNNISAIEPFCSSVEDLPEPTRIGSKQMTMRHRSSLPGQIFYPECQDDLGVLGLESWEEVIDKKHKRSEDVVVSMKYSVPPPLLSSVQKWLSTKKKFKKKPSFSPGMILSPEILQNKAETESLPNTVCSTPINFNIKISSLPDRLITPITKTSLTNFKKNVKFSPNNSFKAPISPTLYMNSQISHMSGNESHSLTAPVGNNTRAHVVQHLTVMSLEAFTTAVGDKQPNPRYDPVIAVFYAFYKDSEEGINEGSICVQPPGCRPKCVPPNMEFVDSECDVFQEIFKIVHLHDPDILIGYQIKTTSLGYLIERANVIGLNFQANISRFPEEVKDIKEDSETGVSNWWVTTTNEIQLAGRVIINLWRLMRTEVNLTNYSFENVAYHVFHERIPKFPHPTLLSFYKDPKHFQTFADYFITRTKGNLRLLLDLNIIIRTSEMGRLFGIEFFNVLSRGTQYRVESMMTRLAKPLNFISLSPSPEQRASMSAPEYIPLIMEPESKFYGDPVVVLDFQSLYPSMIIAYNMCYSTCLGRVNYLGTHGSFPFGASNLTVPPELLKKYQDHIFVSPNGVGFVDPSVRRGILPMMLSEILETRIMVKQMMKQFKEDKALYKMLDARQMALKLIANVTYGYTSANFSGRMPCIEIGDSIVAKGRKTLEAAIDLVNSTLKWGGRVVYGDTDSLFILFKGCSRSEAFRRGQEIADVVTSINPKPVKLKFEKVYQPCVLQTKKRYVGMKYETPDDPGEYEAKGIETVRRDGCPASVKTLKQALHILFQSCDISLVKKFVQNQFRKVIKNQISVQDYIFAKEYRGRDLYRPGACVPALEIAKRRLKSDPRNEPLVGERVQYVICFGTPGLPLIQLVHEPAEVLFEHHLKINTIYYITKSIVPPLQRVFGLMGVNVMGWYNELPRDLRTHFAPSRSKHTISHYYHTKHCPFCDGVSETLCTCYRDRQKVGVLANSHLAFLEDQQQALFAICTECTGTPTVVANPEILHNRNCVSFVCPVLYKRIKVFNRIAEKSKIKADVAKLFDW